MAVMLGVVLIVLALLGGGVHVAILATVSLALTLGMLVALLLKDYQTPFSPPAAPCVWLALWRKASAPEKIYALMLGWFTLSLLPLPLAGTRLHGRVRHDQNRVTATLLHEGVHQGILPESSPTPRFALTRNRAGTWRMLLLMMAAAGAMAMATWVPDCSKFDLIRWLTWLGGAMGAAALLSIFVWPQGQTLLWFFPVQASPKLPLACFENRNHLAGYLAMLCPGALALACRDGLRQHRGKALISAVAWLVMSAAVVASLSRGGMVAWLVGLAAMGGLALWQGRRPLASVFGGLLALALTTALLLPLPGLQDRIKSLGRIQDESSYQIRTDVWRDAWVVWKTYPLAGAGFNAWRTVYPQSRRDSLSAHIAHAENDYVQMLAETGVVGVILGMLLIGALWKRARPQAAARGSNETVVLAAAGALAVAAAHAFVDFTLRTPLAALTLAVLIGLLLSDSKREDVAISPRPFFLTRFSLVVFVAHIGLIVLAAPRLVAIGQWDDPQQVQEQSMETVAHATVWAPTSWYAWYALGRQACAINSPEAARWGEQCLSRAARLDPHNYRLWFQLGRLRSDLGMEEDARRAYERVRQLRSWVRIP